MLKFIKNLKNSHGFSFVEILMALSLLSICALAVMKITDNSRLGSHQVEVVLSKSQFTFLVNKYFNSEIACNELMQVSSYNSSWTPLSLDNFNVAGIEGDPNLPLETGRKFKTFKIKELSAKQIDLSSQNVDNASTDIKTELVVKLVLEVFTKPGANASTNTDGKRDEIFYFNIPIVSDVNKQIKNCDQFASLESICAGLRGVFDRNSKTCKMGGSNCVVRGGYVGPGGAQSVTNPFTGSYTCPSGSNSFVTSTAANLGATGAVACSGKKCSGVEAIGIAGYICLECPSSGGGGVSGSVFGGGGGGGFFGGGSGSGP